MLTKYIFLSVTDLQMLLKGEEAVEKWYFIIHTKTISAIEMQGLVLILEMVLHHAVSIGKGYYIA